MLNLAFAGKQMQEALSTHVLPCLALPCCCYSSVIVNVTFIAAVVVVVSSARPFFWSKPRFT